MPQLNFLSSVWCPRVRVAGFPAFHFETSRTLSSIPSSDTRHSTAMLPVFSFCSAASPRNTFPYILLSAPFSYYFCFRYSRIAPERSARPSRCVLDIIYRKQRNFPRKQAAWGQAGIRLTHSSAVFLTCHRLDTLLNLSKSPLPRRVRGARITRWRQTASPGSQEAQSLAHGRAQQRSSSAAPEGTVPSAPVGWKPAPAPPHCSFLGEGPLLLQHLQPSRPQAYFFWVCFCLPLSPSALSLKQHGSFWGTSAGHHSSAL